MSSMPKCTKCSLEKEITEFYIHSNKKPRKQCKRCILDNNEKNFNLESRLIYAKKYRDTNYELCLARTRQWQKENPEYNRYRNALYTTRKQHQTPSWANLARIKNVYLNCPVGHQVDHIVPLKGKNVSGLHVEYNLQYLTITENLSKGNRYEELL